MPLRLCDIEGRALAMGYAVERYKDALYVGRAGEDLTSQCCWSTKSGEVKREPWGTLTSEEIEALESPEPEPGPVTSEPIQPVSFEAPLGGLRPSDIRGPADPGRALIVTAVAILRVGTGGGRSEAIRQGERLADDLAAKGYLEALAALGEAESVREGDIREEPMSRDPAHDIDF